MSFKHAVILSLLPKEEKSVGERSLIALMRKLNKYIQY